MLKKDRRAAAKKMNKLSASEAKETTIYFVNSNGSYKENTVKLKSGKVVSLTPFYQPTEFFIEEDNEFSFVMNYAEETTSPRGVEDKLHIREKNGSIYQLLSDKDVFITETEFEDLSNEDQDLYEYYGESVIAYEVWNWGTNGNNPHMVDSFETEEEAEDYIYDATYNYDYQNSANYRQYFESKEDALDELYRQSAYAFDVSEEVAKSIHEHQLIANAIKASRKQEAVIREKQRKAQQAERVEKLAPEYAKLIDKVEGESYNETCSRLKHAIGEKIEGVVFHAAVQLIRKK